MTDFICLEDFLFHQLTCVNRDIPHCSQRSSADLHQARALQISNLKLTILSAARIFNFPIGFMQLSRVIFLYFAPSWVCMCVCSTLGTDPSENSHCTRWE